MNGESRDVAGKFTALINATATAVVAVVLISVAYSAMYIHNDTSLYT